MNGRAPRFIWRAAWCTLPLMKLGSVVWVSVLGIAVAAACSSDNDGSGVKCGAGTVLKDGECVIDVGAGAPGEGGGGGSQAGKGSTGGTLPHDGGRPNESDPEGGSLSVAGAGNGGEGGDGTVVPPVKTTRWLAFSHDKGVFAYDVTKFPVETALVTLGAAPQAPYYYGLSWSPDGRTLVYANGGKYQARDMSGEVPGEPRLLLSAPEAPTLNRIVPLGWSAGSDSVSIVSKRTLSVLDPSVDAPTLHPLTTTVLSYAWAPRGNRLLFSDDKGSYVVAVDHGVPGTPIPVDPGSDIWSPTGAQLAGITKAGNLSLTTFSATSASFELITDGSGEQPSGSAGHGGVPAVEGDPPVEWAFVNFSPDGSQLSFSAEIDGKPLRPYIVTVEPSLGKPKLIAPGAAEGNESICYWWSPDGAQVICESFDNSGSQAFAAAPATGDVIELAAKSFWTDWRWSPAPERHQLVTTHFDGNTQYSLGMVDLAAPDELVTLDALRPTSFTVGPRGTHVGYMRQDDKHALHLVSIDDPADKLDIETDPTAYDPLMWEWSPDNRFISLSDGSFRMRLVRFDGTNVTTPVILRERSQYRIYSSWQP
jgi:hypothetical protein